MLGVFLVIAVEILGIRSLSFAVGAYLSIATTLAIFAGGIVRWMIDRAVEKTESESEVSPGSLYASGLIAAGGIVGLIGVALKLYETATGKQDVLLFPANNFLHHDWVSVLMFVLLAGSLYYFARKPLKRWSKNIPSEDPLNCRSLGCARDDKQERDLQFSGPFLEMFFDLLRAQALQGIASPRAGAVDAHRRFEGLFGTVTVAAVDEDLAVVVERCGGKLRG